MLPARLLLIHGVIVLLPLSLLSARLLLLLTPACCCSHCPQV
jgi:hypothetical protein